MTPNNKSKEASIDIREFLIMSLGYNNYLHETIDKFYKENKLKYYKYYRESNYFNSKLFSLFTYEKEEYMKKVAGIVQHSYSVNNFLILFQLIKKGYKFSWNFVEHREIVDLDEFSESLLKRYKSIEGAPELEIMNYCIVTYYLTVKMKKILLAKNPSGEAVRSYMINLISNAFSADKVFTKETFDVYKDELNQFKNDYFLNTKNEISVSEVFDRYISDALKMAHTVAKPNNFDDISNIVSGTGLNKYVGIYGGIIKLVGLTPNDVVGEIKLTNEEINKLGLHYHFSNEEFKINSHEKKILVVSSLFLYSLLKRYLELKNKGIKDLEEEFYYQMSKVEGQLEKEKENIKNKEEEIDSMVAQRDKKLALLEEELALLKKENKSLSQELSSKEDYSKEVHALREYIFSLSSEEEDKDIDGINIEEIMATLNSKKIAVIGGNVNWQNKMKEIFSNWSLISSDNKNFDSSFLDNLDGLVYIASSNSHAIYKKVMKRMNKNKTPLYYINGTTNIEKTISKLNKVIN